MPKILDIQPTPNENAMRFILYDNLTSGESYSYETKESSQEDELAKNLFELKGVVNVYYLQNYLTITQDGSREWGELLREAAPFIRETKKREPRLEEYKPSNINDPRIQEITHILSTTILPYLMMDGGGLDIVDLKDDILFIHYQGACSSCSISGDATLMSIQSIIRQHFPKITVKNI
jgi:Fe-S cluster biogenesis protein NfuA